MPTKKSKINGQHGSALSIWFLFLYIAILFFLYSDISSAMADNLTVKVGVYENAPKIFTSESGKPAGIFIDILEHIAETEGWTLQYVAGTWAEGLDRLAKGEVDLMPDVAYTADRGKIFSFHKLPVLSSWSQVYTRKGSGIQSILNLNQKRVAVLQGSVQQEAFARLADSFGLQITLIPVPDYNYMFEMVARNEADAAVTNNVFGPMNAKKFGLEDTAVIFNPSTLFFAAPRNSSKQLLDNIDNRLSELKKDPQSIYYKSLKRWISEEVKFELPVWLQMAGIVMGIVLFLSLLGSLLLKHQVNTRTRELQEAQQQFADIVEFLPDATFVIDQDKKIIAWNQACVAMTGVKKAALLGQGNYAYAEPFFGERRPILIDLLDIPAPEVEAKYKYVQRKDDRIYAESFISQLGAGKGVHLWGVASPLYDQDGRRCGAIESIRDVTEQKRIAEALRASEQEYRELVMLANSIILRWSRDGRITFMNEFGLRFFGYSQTDIIGRHILGSIVPENETTGRALSTLIKEISIDPQKYERNLNENMRSNGERVWIDWTNRVVLDEKGKIKEIMSIGSDITDRKQAEEQIRRLNDELQRHAEVLEKRVTERTAELAAAMEKAQAADRIKSAFLATMSHELRTPLNSIIGFTGILLQGLAGPMNEEQNKQLNMVQNSSRHLLSLINDVLDISKIEAGQLELSVTAFDLRPSIEKMIKLVSPLADKKGIALELDISENIGKITTDQLRLEQVILNLLNNAVKFTEKGHVSTSCRIENDHYILSFSDTGIGMRPEEIPNLFQPFHQIDTGIARKREGTGLGLSICRKIIDMMGGSISVESRLGQGSIFTLHLPISQGGLS